jgi:hypothetical protein
VGAPAGSPALTFNSTELRKVNVDLEVVCPPRQELNVLARERRSVALASDVRRRHSSVVRWHVQEVTAPVPTRRWKLAAAEENIILGHCCP